MSWEQIVGIVIGTLALGGVAACFYFGKDYLKYHNIFGPVLEAFVAAAKGLSGAFPDNNVLSIIATVAEIALEGAEKAERLWLNGELNKDLRNEYAKNYIAEMLGKAGIEVNASIAAMIDGFIAVACMIFPHGQELKINEENTKE